MSDFLHRSVAHVDFVIMGGAGYFWIVRVSEDFLMLSLMRTVFIAYLFPSFPFLRGRLRSFRRISIGTLRLPSTSWT